MSLKNRIAGSKLKSIAEIYGNKKGKGSGSSPSPIVEYETNPQYQTLNQTRRLKSPSPKKSVLINLKKPIARTLKKYRKILGAKSNTIKLNRSSPSRQSSRIKYPSREFNDFYGEKTNPDVPSNNLIEFSYSNEPKKLLRKKISRESKSNNRKFGLNIFDLYNKNNEDDVIEYNENNINKYNKLINKKSWNVYDFEKWKIYKKYYEEHDNFNVELKTPEVTELHIKNYLDENGKEYFDDSNNKNKFDDILLLTNLKKITVETNGAIWFNGLLREICVELPNSESLIIDGKEIARRD
jgi:hypothetical protein